MIICRECEEELDTFNVLTDDIDEWYYCPECTEIGIQQGLKEVED